MLPPIFIHANSCAYLIDVYTLTCRHTIIEYGVPKDRLRKKHNCKYKRKMLHSGDFVKIYNMASE